MSHPIEDGIYWIRLVGDEVKHVAALEGNNPVAVIPEDFPVAFSFKLWKITRADHGYKIQNVALNKYAFAPRVVDNLPVYLNEELFTTFDIQPDGKDIWRFVVPEHDLDWTEADFVRGATQGYVKLSGSQGIDRQRFVLQRFIGP